MICDTKFNKAVGPRKKMGPTFIPESRVVTEIGMLDMSDAARKMIFT